MKSEYMSTCMHMHFSMLHVLDGAPTLNALVSGTSQVTNVGTGLDSLYKTPTAITELFIGSAHSRMSPSHMRLCACLSNFRAVGRY